MRKRTKINKTTLANRLGIARSTLHTWEASGAPVERGEKAVREWAEKEALNPSADSPDLKEAKRLVLTETARRLKTANDTKDGLLVSRAEAETTIAEVTGALFHGLDRLTAELPPKLAGLTPDAMQQQLLLSLDALKAGIRAAFADLNGAPADALEAVKRGEAALAKHVQATVGQRCFAERCEAEYLTFRRWLDEELKIRAEKFAEWQRLRGAMDKPTE